MKKLMHFLFLSCLKATELIEKNLHFKLSLIEKIQMKLHKMMCDACVQYEKQSLIIEKGINKLNRKENPDIDFKSLKTRISLNIKNSSKK